MSDEPRALCGARTRSGVPCNGWAMPNGRCRLHGGLSTGPRTPEGLERSRKARWKHGNRSKAAIAAFRETREVRRLIRDLIIQSERK